MFSIKTHKSSINLSWLRYNVAICYSGWLCS